MPKQNIICLNCGTVQVRTDLSISIEKSYVFLKEKHRCPKCESFTNHLATNDVDQLRKRLTKNCENGKDEKVLKLIKR